MSATDESSETDPVRPTGVADDPPRGRSLPGWLVLGGAAAWRLLALGAVIYFGFQVLRRVSVVALAVVIALFPTAALWRPVRWLDHRGWPAGLAAFSVMFTALAAITGLGFLIVPAVGESAEDLTTDLGEAAESVRSWLTEGPLGLSARQVDEYWSSLTESVAEGTALTSGLLGGASALVELLTGLVLMLVVSFFMLRDGERLLGALLRRVPPHRRDAVQRGTSSGGHALARYMGGLAVIGLFDAVTIGTGLWIIGVPLVVPLALFVFFGAFFPVVGAWVTGLAAVAVAFVNGGLTDALIVLALITAVEQVESNVMDPLVFGRTLEIHPLMIVLAVVAGGVAFGVIGAFLFVPLLAVGLTVQRELSGDPRESYWALTQGVGSLKEESE